MTISPMKKTESHLRLFWRAKVHAVGFYYLYYITVQFDVNFPNFCMGNS